ncbi:phage holin family protein [Herbaspirillum autotrophicum]|uniref:phage holin family protein n=1 Tax=Herbaspirillum autotrophicum TaxID=180195 RepID=UPI000AF97514|nr:phage holin family protein [Herbaspirillum autotrophicum]
MEHKHPQSESGNPGLVAGLLGITRNLLALIINRIELAALEFSEIGANLVRFVVMFSLAIVALWFAVAFWTVLLVFLAWESWGWKILFLFGALFTAIAGILAWQARALLQKEKLALPATMAELRKDRDALL